MQSFPGQPIGLMDTSSRPVSILPQYQAPMSHGVSFPVPTHYDPGLNTQNHNGSPNVGFGTIMDQRADAASAIMKAQKNGKISVLRHVGSTTRMVPTAGEIRGLSERNPYPDIKMNDTRFLKTQKTPWQTNNCCGQNATIDYESIDHDYASRQLYPLVQADMPIAAQRQFFNLSNKPGEAYTTAPSVIPGVPLSYLQPRCTGGPRVLWKQALQVLPFVETADYDPYKGVNDYFCINEPWLGRDYAQYWVYPSKLASPYVSPASPDAMPLFLNSDKSYLSPQDGAVVSGTYLKGNLCASPNCVPFCQA